MTSVQEIEAQGWSLTPEINSRKLNMGGIMNRALNCLMVVGCSFFLLIEQVGAITLSDLYPGMDKLEKKTIYIPAIETDAVAELGATLLSSFYTVTSNQLLVKDDVSCETSWVPGVWIFPKGARLYLHKETDDGFQFRSPGFQFKYAGSTVGSDASKIFVSKTDPNQLKVILNQFLSTSEFQCSGLALELKEVQTAGEGDLKKELAYTGISKGVISVTYREFIKDMARPAFTQDLKFDLAEGDLIGFKGSRFKVISANNVEIKYQVVKPLQ